MVTHLEQTKAPESSQSSWMEKLGQVLNREGAARQQEVRSIAAVHGKPIAKVFP